MKDRYTELSRKTYAPPVGEAPAAVVGVMLLQDAEIAAPVALLKLRMDSEAAVSAVGVRVFLKDARHDLAEQPENYWYTNISAGQGSFFGAKTPLPLPEAEISDIVAEVAAVRFADGSTWFAETSCNGAEPCQSAAVPVAENQPAAAPAPDAEALAALAAAEAEAKAAERAEARAKRAAKLRKVRRIALIGGSAAAAAVLIIFLAIPFAKYSIANHKMSTGEYESAAKLYASLDQFGQSRERRVVANALQQITDGGFEKGISTLLTKNVAVHISYDTGAGRFTQEGTPADVSYTNSAEFSALPDAERDYYTFHGWKLEQSVYAHKQKAMSTDLSFSAVYEPIPYTISYTNLGDGKVSNPTDYTVESADIMLSAPKREGYTFLGWSGTDIQGTQTAVTLPAGSHGNKSFKANWKANTYTVKLSAKGEQAAEGEENFRTKDFSFTYDDAYALPRMEKRGYTFLGWTDGKNTYLEGTWNCASNVELTPAFELTVYHLSYELAGGVPDKENPDSYTMLDKDISLYGATRFGYQFVGWTWDDQPEAQKNAVLRSGSVGDKVITALWEGNKHTVSMDAAGGSVSASTATVVFGSKYSLPTPVKTGYDFTGWYSGNTKYTSGTWDLDEDIKVKAGWSAKKFSIPLDAAGGSCSASSVSVTYDSSYSLPTPTRKGYSFQGWYNGGTRYSGGTWTTDGAVTLSAQWEGNKYTVSLSANGGSVSSGSVSVVFGSPYSLPTPTRTGYDFAGWSTSSGSYGSTFPASGTWNTDSNVTLYAKWEVKRCTIYMDLAGGTSYGGTTQSVTYGSRYYLSTPSREGYSFDGWYYGGTKFESSGTYEYDGDITVVARWTGKTYSCYLYANGGSGVPSSVDMTYGSAYSLPTPYREGYTFDGWYTSRIGGTYFPASGVWNKTGYQSLYAHWTEQSES